MIETSSGGIQVYKFELQKLITITTGLQTHSLIQNSKIKTQNFVNLTFVIIIFMSAVLLTATPLHALSSANLPLDSPVYLYLEKLSGMGLIKSDIRGLKPYSRAETARLIVEAEENSALSNNNSTLAVDLIKRIREIIPREIVLRNDDSKVKFIDFNPILSSRLRFVHLDGQARNFERTSWDSAHQSAFGFIGGDLRPLGNGGPVHITGTEGTPLLENNNGTIHNPGSSFELRFSAEGSFLRYATIVVEPQFLLQKNDSAAKIEKGYLTIGSGGVAVEIGRDENWFGPGYRGTTVLTNNARNFDQIKLWSPEPVDLTFIKKYLGNVKYALIFSQFDQTGSGSEMRKPYLLAGKLSIQPKPWWEIGANFARQMGGPGFEGSPDTLLGGGKNDHSNSIAGIDLRFRIPSLRNTEIYAEFSGEDNAGGVWPIVESYVAGFFIPCLTSSCSDDFRFEYFFGSVMLYGDWQFPAGYVYHDMTPGHSQGGAGVQEFFSRYTHWFAARNNIAIDYFYTERGRSYRTGTQVMESKHAGRINWNMPLYGDVDGQAEYGIERINNFNLVAGAPRTNQLLKLELRYRY